MKQQVGSLRELPLSCSAHVSLTISPIWLRPLNLPTSRTCGRRSRRPSSSSLMWYVLPVYQREREREREFWQEGARLALILDRTIFYPQGGGQPADHGWIQDTQNQLKFRVEDVRMKDGLVYHYGFYCHGEGAQVSTSIFLEGQEVCILVDKERRILNSRLHSAGHLLDVCMPHIGLAYLEPSKGYHFLDGPFVEYKGTIPLTELDSKRQALETEINRLIMLGGKVKASIVSYEEALAMCGGKVPSYISKEDRPRIVCLGDNPGCPCGGTHVADIANIGEVKVTQIRVKKGITKVSYCLQK